MTATSMNPLRVTRSTPRTGGSRRESRGALAALVLPATIWYTVFTIGPLVAVFVIAMLDWSGFLSRAAFAGFDNFQTVFADPVFYQAIKVTIIQILLGVPVIVVAAFMIGYYLALRPRGHRVLRTLLFTPALISVAARAMIFLVIFSPTGLLNGVLSSIGLDALTTPWLANSSTALSAIVAVDLWSGIGYLAILFSARLSSVTGEVLEAAELDGAGHLRRIWGVAFPIAKEYFGVLTMLQFVWTLFGSAATVLLLTKGGPGYDTMTLSFLIYDKAFNESQLGYSQAVGVVIFVFGLLGSVVIRRMFRQNY